MDNVPSLYGKTLPVFFTQGYLDSLWHVVGNAQRIASYQAAAEHLIPNQTLRTQWLTPLFDYMIATGKEPQPLDYRFVTLFQMGLALFGPEYRHNIQKWTRQAGKEWWYGEPPISTYQDQTGLQYHFASRIRDVLNTNKFGASGITHDTVKGMSDLGSLAIATFLKYLNEESGIPFEVSITPRSIVLDVLVCPFCLQEHDLCSVWEGILQGVIEWLYGHWREEQRGIHSLHLNSRMSTNHQIIISIQR